MKKILLGNKGTQRTFCFVFDFFFLGGWRGGGGGGVEEDKGTRNPHSVGSRQSQQKKTAVPTIVNKAFLTSFMLTPELLKVYSIFYLDIDLKNG